jgi:GNAT superfamily N-acetyltransferase
VSIVAFPEGFRLASLDRSHPRRRFDCGAGDVTDWLRAKALQSQQKRLSATKVLLDPSGMIAGFYTLATGQVDFGDLPPELARKLPRRTLPVAVLAWLGVDRAHQNQGLGKLLLAQALRDCYDAGRTFAFVAVIIDCIDNAAKAFYQQWDFAELPGYPYRLALSASLLAAMMDER